MAKLHQYHTRDNSFRWRLLTFTIFTGLFKDYGFERFFPRFRKQAHSWYGSQPDGYGAHGEVSGYTNAMYFILYRHGQ